MEQLTKHEYCALEILKAMISNPELSKGFITPTKHNPADFIYDNAVMDCAILMAVEFLEICDES